MVVGGMEDEVGARVSDSFAGGGNNCTSLPGTVSLSFLLPRGSNKCDSEESLQYILPRAHAAPDCRFLRAYEGDKYSCTGERKYAVKRSLQRQVGRSRSLKTFSPPLPTVAATLALSFPRRGGRCLSSFARCPEKKTLDSLENGTKSVVHCRKGNTCHPQQSRRGGKGVCCKRGMRRKELFSEGG